MASVTFFLDSITFPVVLTEYGGMINRRNSPRSQMSLNCFWQALCTDLKYKYSKICIMRPSQMHVNNFSGPLVFFLLTKERIYYLWHQQQRKSTIPGPSPQASSHTSHSEFRGKFPAIQWCKNFLRPWPRSCEWVLDLRWLSVDKSRSPSLAAIF